MAKTTTRPFISTGPGGDLLFVALVVAAYASLFSGGLLLFSPLETGLLLLAGAAYTGVGVYGARRLRQPGSARLTGPYFAFQLLLVGAIVHYSHGLAWLLTLPLVGHAVEFLPRPWMVVTCALSAVPVLVSLGLAAPSLLQANLHRLVALSADDSLLFGAQSAAQYLVAVVFVILLTEVAVRERAARAEVERLAAELGEANRKLRDYALQAEELATVQERNRLAREIHDGLGHYLTALNVQIEAARAVLERDRPRALDALGKAQTLAQEGLSDVRRSVAALRASPAEGRPLPEAVGTLVDECRTAGVAVALTVDGPPRALSPQVELTLYRAAQEGLTNVRKHARASRVDVVLDYRDPAAVRLSVQDDGAGSADTGGGFGLLGLRERAQRLGGQVRVRAQPGLGFTLEVEVPG